MKNEIKKFLEEYPVVRIKSNNRRVEVIDFNVSPYNILTRRRYDHVQLHVRVSENDSMFYNSSELVFSK